MAGAAVLQPHRIPSSLLYPPPNALLVRRRTTTTTCLPWRTNRRVVQRQPRCFAAAAEGNADVPKLLVAAARYHSALRAKESLRQAWKNSFHETPGVEGNGEVGFYELATRFIDDKLLEVVKDVNNPVRQVVMLTDGMDTRPYRLRWPSVSVIFDISPSITYTAASEEMKAVGAKVPKSCLFRHVSVDLAEDGDWKDEGWGEKLVRLGFRGDQPSVWTMQGLQTLTAEGLQVVLQHASSMAMKDSIFAGELPLFALGDISKEDASETLSRVFGGHGFEVKLMLYEDIAAGLSLRNRHVADTCLHAKGTSVLFVARQLRLSDDQVEYFRSRIEQAEEEGDEDGFEEV